MIYPEEKRYNIALERFLEQHPEIKKKLDSINQTEAAACRRTLEDYREMILKQEFSDKAKSMGITDTYELIMRYVADSEEELETMRIEYYKGATEVMNIS